MINKSLLALAASLMTFGAFAGTTVIMGAHQGVVAQPIA